MTSPTQPRVLSADRLDLLNSVADRVSILSPSSGNRFIAIDGVDGSGKTAFAEQLTSLLLSRGMSAVQVSIDGFHHPRAVRYRQGRDSPQGFWEDSYDYDGFFRAVVAPLTRPSTWTYKPAIHNVATDERLSLPSIRVVQPTVFVIDGIFLHRKELRDIWNLSIFLDVRFEISVSRMAARDGGHVSPDHATNRRYVEGQMIYFESATPWTIADIVIDNNDLARPFVIKREELRRN